MNIAILLAGGTGSRLESDTPKQFLTLSGKMMLLYALEPFALSEYINNIIIVADESYHEKIESEIYAEAALSEKFLGFADPGENRQLSILNALTEIEKLGLSDSTDTVIVHDAARPFVTAQIIKDCILAAYEHDGAMPVLPMNDTVYFSRNGKSVEELLNRSCIYAGQAPEAFNYAKYLAANKALLPDKILLIKGSTEAAIMSGMDIAMIPGDQRNFKVTTREDFERAQELLRQRLGDE